MAGVRIDSGEVPLLRDIDMRHQPSRAKVRAAWIIQMRNVEHALEALPLILEDIARFRPWEIEAMPEGLSGVEGYLKRVGIDRVRDHYDELLDSDVWDDFIDRVMAGDRDAASVISAHVSDVQAARDNPLKGHGGAREQGDNITLNKPSKKGTSRSYTLRRLARDRPDLLDRVDAGELSANAAAIEAGFRRVKTPEEQVLHWWGRCSEEERARVLAALATRNEAGVSM